MKIHLVFPLIVLYSLTTQSDFIPNWGEDETAEEGIGKQVLAEPLPCGMGENGEYNWKSVEVCMESLIRRPY
ncbi:hypothetical protein BGX38DRAFT_1162587 [Terfezia claveryi]|nr:hypothetical protein BGX38DRAFT_1162587 [Terfezia claveryi]